MNEPIFEIKTESKKKNYARFVISPLESGYGHTLGNSLRRVLLMSLSGAAVTSVKVAGVKHRFSTLKGMKEDVVEFVLNLKKLSFVVDANIEKEMLESQKPEKATISVTGPGEVRAKDIKLPATLKIVNPELVLANLNKGSKLSAEMQIKAGVGYALAEEESEVKGIGVIPLDASYSPVTRVNYKVEETRVGRLTNYDKLVMEIWTDGTTESKLALKKAADILVSYFNQVVSPKKVAVKEEDTQIDVLGPTGKLSVEEIGLPTRVANALVKADVHTVEDLVNADREELMKVRNLGEKSLKIIDVALAEKGVNVEEINS